MAFLFSKHSPLYGGIERPRGCGVFPEGYPPAGRFAFCLEE